MYIPTDIEIERRNRIKLSLAAYAYDMIDNPIMTDSEFDKRAKAIRPDMSTEHEVMDQFFRDHFNSYTGSWIHGHPELSKLIALYKSIYEENMMDEYIKEAQAEVEKIEEARFSRLEHLNQLAALADPDNFK